MRPNAPKYLRDILEMAALISRSTADKTYDDYVADIALRHQVQHEFLIICEAVRQLSEHHPAIAAQISNRTKIVGMRVFLAHRYGDVDDSIIWQSIGASIPILVQEAEGLLQNADHLDKSE